MLPGGRRARATRPVTPQARLEVPRLVKLRAMRATRPVTPQARLETPRLVKLRAMRALPSSQPPVRPRAMELGWRWGLPPLAFWSSVLRWRVPWRVRWGSAPCLSLYRPRRSFEASGRFRLQAPDEPWPVQRRAQHLHRAQARIPAGASPLSRTVRAREIRRRGRATMVWSGRRSSSVLQGDRLFETRIARRKERRVS